MKEPEKTDGKKLSDAQAKLADKPTLTVKTEPKVEEGKDASGNPQREGYPTKADVYPAETTERVAQDDDGDDDPFGTKGQAQQQGRQAALHGIAFDDAPHGEGKLLTAWQKGYKEINPEAKTVEQKAKDAKKAAKAKGN